MSIATTSTPLAAMARSIGSSAWRSLRFHAPPCRSSSVGNGPAPCGWYTRAISWRPAALRRNGTSLTFTSSFALGSYFVTVGAPRAGPNAMPAIVSVVISRNARFSMLVPRAFPAAVIRVGRRAFRRARGGDLEEQAHGLREHRERHFLLARDHALELFGRYAERVAQRI